MQPVETSVRSDGLRVVVRAAGIPVVAAAGLSIVGLRADVLSVTVGPEETV